MRFKHLPAVVLLVTFSAVLTCADDAPKHNAQKLKESYEAFIKTLDNERIARDYAKAVQKLDPDNGKEVLAGLRTLAATEEPDVIPWIAPLLEADTVEVRIWAGSSLQKVVSAYQLKRPRGADELRPLAWIVLRMLQKPDDGNSLSYAATMIAYLNLKEFEPELQMLLKSRHPAVTNAAKFALEMIGAKVDFGIAEDFNYAAFR